MKKTKNKKKVSRETPKKAPRAKTQELVIKVQAISAPTPADLGAIKDGGKYMIPKTWMSEKQVVKLVQKTPPKYIYERPAKGGGKWSYVTGHYVERVLNYTFGWNWDFEVQNHGREANMVWVLGKLTVKDDHGHTITKSQFGRADIKFKSGGKEMLDFGNDLKAATTDAMKKCASLLGIASDVYGKAEYKQEAGVEVVDAPQLASGSPKTASQTMKEGQVMVEGKPTYVCSKCGTPISEAEHNFSVKMFKKPLCREDQPKNK